MYLIDNAYDNALRDSIPNDLYDADSINLHLIGIGMDNGVADAAYDAQRAAEFNAEAQALGLVF